MPVLAQSLERAPAPRVEPLAPVARRGTLDSAPRVQDLGAMASALNGRSAVVAQRLLAHRLAGSAHGSMGQGGPTVQRVAQPRGQVIQLGAASSKTDENATLHADYQKFIVKAVGLLEGKIGFGASPQGNFDERCWKQIPDEDYKLAIETIVNPSVALKALVSASNGLWSFDCAEFVQICNLYATMKLYGDGTVDKKKPLVLRQHKSTTFQGGGYTFDRSDAGAKFDVIDHGRKNAYVPAYLSEAELLGHVPAGSRVCFKNPAAPDTPYRNENSIALGGGTYAAHPMGTNLTAEQIVDKLVSFNRGQGLGGEDAGRSQIFISQVEVYSSISRSAEMSEALKLPSWE